jgi:hypothetical protein
VLGKSDEKCFLRLGNRLHCVHGEP